MITKTIPNPTGESSGKNFVLITWSEKYYTGVPLVDSQHRELIKLTNELYNACMGGKEKTEAVFKDAMRRMVDYVRFHFNAEQELLKQINYPDYPHHKMQHDSLVKDIIDAAAEYKEGVKFVPNNFVRRLKDWIFSHIAVYDQQWAGYVHTEKANGNLIDLGNL